MRLLELSLDRYGPFEGLRLDFDPQAQIHIVHGANEAGKSSALQAIGDLFYGAPRRAEKSFLRPTEMRIGASIRGRNGQILQFIRKRGLKNTLLDASGSALPDDALAPFLGAATREIFHRAFGLDAASLRAGGDDMLRAEGEIGASLFAAASGLRGLIELRAGLEAEAEQIFDDRRASHRAFYRALGRFEAAKAQEKSAFLSETTLKKLRADLVAAGERIAEIEAAERLGQSEALRLERQRKAAPILKKLEALRTDFAGFDDLASFSPDWAQRLDALLAARKAAGEQAARAREASDAARRELEGAGFDEALLVEAQTIEDLIRASGAYEKSASDLPRREAALRDVRQRLIARAQACGVAGLDELRVALPDLASLARAERLVAQGRTLLAKSIEPRRALQQEESRFAALRERQPKVLPDAASLREKFQAFGPVENRDASLRELTLACADEARDLAEKCARLSPPLADLERFAQNSSPDALAIETAAKLFDESAEAEKAARRAACEAEEQGAAAQAQLRALELGGRVASLADLRAARDARNETWLALLGAPQGGETARHAFEEAQQRADAIADVLIGDAARVAAAEAERAKLADASAQRQGAEKSLADIEQNSAKQTGDWASAWAACGIAPAPPRQMVLWRSRADALLEARDALARKQARAALEAEDLAKNLPGLQALAGECGLQALPLEAAALARRIAAKIQDLARAEVEAREILAEIAKAPARIAEQQARLAELHVEEAQWRSDWGVALRGLQLDDEATFDEAQARIALWRALPGELQDEAEKAQRVLAIAEDIEAFERKLDALLALCARDLPARPAPVATAQLRDRLAQARQQSALHDRAGKGLAQADTASSEAEALSERAGAALAAFCDESGFSGEAALLAERLGRREILRAGIDAERASLALVADGFDEAVLAGESQNFDADAARIRLAEIARQSEERIRERDLVVASRSAAETELAGLQQSGGAETAIFAREAARAEIAEQARRWAVLKLAALLVQTGMERHRDRRKDPLLARAGGFFARLTETRYAGLDQDFGDGEDLHLRARRADGAELAMDALSEGARDQLYLALRLAFLEDYAQRSEAPPFIGDDLFASFDDRRVAAGLTTLAGAGGAFQSIIFTHHEHVVAIARESLGDRAQILRLG